MIVACRPLVGGNADSQHHLLGPLPPPPPPPSPHSKEGVRFFKRQDKIEKRLVLGLAGPKRKGRLVPSKKFLGLHGLL